MAKFKVGDFVIANEQADLHYSITRGSWVGIVKEVRSNGDIGVVPADDPNRPAPFEVCSDYFDPYSTGMDSIKNNQLLIYLLEDKFDQIITFLEDTDTNGDKDIYSSIASILCDLSYEDCIVTASQGLVNQTGIMQRNKVMQLLRPLVEICNKELKNRR